MVLSQGHRKKDHFWTVPTPQNPMASKVGKDLELIDSLKKTYFSVFLGFLLGFLPFKPEFICIYF